MTLKFILEKGILTGSRAFGGYTKASDYDLIMNKSEVDEILLRNMFSDFKICKPANDVNKPENYDYIIWGEELNRIFKFTIETGEVINVFEYTDDFDIMIFHDVNRVMNMLDNTNKDRRIDNFVDTMYNAGIFNIAYTI